LNYSQSASRRNAVLCRAEADGCRVAAPVSDLVVLELH